ncbi:MAG: DUF983 domain-containing protein [Gemmatimonadales bacterium]
MTGLFIRAIMRRCPACGSGGIFSNWFRMVEVCPGCGLPLERRESGYVVGAYMFNIIFAELVFAAIFIAVLLATWPSPPWTILTWGGVALMIILPILFYPVSRTVFLAFDLVFRPAGSADGDRER